MFFKSWEGWGRSPSPQSGSRARCKHREPLVFAFRRCIVSLLKIHLKAEAHLHSIHGKGFANLQDGRPRCQEEEGRQRWRTRLLCRWSAGPCGCRAHFIVSSCLDLSLGFALQFLGVNFSTWSCQCRHNPDERG